LNSYDNNNSDSENLKAACLAVNKSDNKLSEKACYAAENEIKNEKTYQVQTDSC